MQTVIECRALTKVYLSGEITTTVLNGVSLSVQEGEYIAITGPSGSGKSTLMHILGALDSPTSGEYLLDGVNVHSLSDNELAEIRVRKIGFVFQSFNLLARATVMRNVQLPLVYADTPVNERRALAERALRSAGMNQASWDNRSNQLSGGQMQRVAIARALVNNPALLLADEPTGNLDQKTGKVVLGTFQALNNQGKTVILITHDQFVAEHASRIIAIRDGCVIEDKQNTKRRSVGEAE